jgi:hypothetical protein
MAAPARKRRRGFLPNAEEAIGLLNDRLVDHGIDARIFQTCIERRRVTRLRFTQSSTPWRDAVVQTSQTGGYLLLQTHVGGDGVFHTSGADSAQEQADAMLAYMCENDLVSVSYVLK